MVRNRKAQSILEYSVITTVVIAALIAIQAYVKRGLQGKLKATSDDIGEQYSPGITTSHIEVASDYTSTETLLRGGHTTTEISAQSEVKTGNETVGSEADEYWIWHDKGTGAGMGNVLPPAPPATPNAEGGGGPPGVP